MPRTPRRTEQPFEHHSQMVMCWRRSHGRALNRYGSAVSAPTGQTSTQLPHCSHASGCRSNDEISVNTPRWCAVSAFSPITSSQ